ncbi:MAG: Gfo/Idh/MocA family oxidoreductase [Bacteroidetes bacterium]|uniref:Gfo/Idh/MocA family protein n=1 Tax=Phnomibacter sp. TaxID=2836217 RepID=UPI002FDEC227|nr:Gfo/Idh/MocA family oxidoreductase [Bacteroidota bacterium]
MSSSRRHFLQSSAVLSAGILLHPQSLFAAPAIDKVRLGFIGVGLRGQNHLDLALRRSDVHVVSICDIDEGMLATSLKMVKDSGKPEPKVYKGDVYAYRKLLEAKDIDAIIISTPWEWHKPMIIDALERGIKYVGTEVMLGITLQDHWDVVKACEKHKAQVMQLENVCYRRDVMAVMNMVRQGVFGEIIHLQGGYQHDLRGVKFNDGKTPYDSGAEFGEKGYSEAKWRTQHSVDRNGDLYPTHGIGPVAMMIDINRGNRFTKLSSFASKARGLHDYVVKKGGADHPNAKVQFKLGDVVTTQIGCANGETILLQHDTNLPRPYSLGFRVQGTKGLWMDINKSIHIEGISKPHQWEAAKEWLDKYDHPLWKKYGNDAQGAGHGGMDFFVVHAFIESVKRQTVTPQDVYDAAAWSAITPLSEISVAEGKTVDFPDFTNGKWKNRKNTFAIDDTY